MSSSMSAFAQLLPISLSSRTVYVKCSPAPASFFERRAVLRALQKNTFETVETFKKLEDNSSFIAVTSKPGTATALVNDSPLTRTIITEEPSAAAAPSRSSWGAKYDLARSITTPVNTLPASQANKATNASADLGLLHKTFTLHIFPANADYNHLEAVKRNPLHGRWPSGGVETYMSAALNKTVPAGAMAPALRDWETGNQLSRDSTGFAGEGREGAAYAILGKKRLSARENYLMERIRHRKNVAETPDVMKSLTGFADQCARDRTATSTEQHKGANE